MLRVAASNTTCNERTCPQILDDPVSGDVYVQGKDDVAPKVVAEAAPPAGERLIRIPRQDRNLIIRAGRQFAEDELFATARSVFRLETLPAYQLNPLGEERFRAFMDGRDLPERSPANSPHLAQIAERTAAGATWTRVHVVRWPLTDLMRFELLTDLENVAAGERVLVADSDAHPDLLILRQDFWLFNGDTALLMHYDPTGRFIRAEISTDPDVIRRCRRQYDSVIVRVVRVADYLERVGLTPAKVG